MFIDKVEITIKAGNGGNGHTSFHSDRMTVHGGPDGGDGGKGGDIAFVGTTRVDNLIDFRYTKSFKAENGVNGRPSNCTGANGKDLDIFVPLGTKILNENGELLADIMTDGERYKALRGGAGGRGNARFATSRRQTPNFSQSGVKTAEHTVKLELQSIADVGFIGFPNVGKSTLLSVVTRANPKISNYHFTTLHPNIGVYSLNGKSMILADIPGLIEGASRGAGLGIDFLKHINRTRLLVHVVDISEQEGRNAVSDFLKVNAELGGFSAELAAKPQIIALNKCDADEPDTIAEKCAKFKSEFSKKYKIFEISAATMRGVDDLMRYTAAEVSKLPRAAAQVSTVRLETKIDKNAFTVNRDDEGAYVVTGALIDNLIRGVVLSDTESNAYFQRRLTESGVIAALTDAGMREGDTIKIADIEFEWID